MKLLLAIPTRKYACLRLQAEIIQRWRITVAFASWALSSCASIGIPANSLQLARNGRYITFLFLTNIVHMRDFCHSDKIRYRDHARFTYFDPLWIRENGFWYAVCMYVSTFMCLCVDLRLDSAWTVRRMLFTFGIQEVIHHSSVPGELAFEHSSSKNRGPSNEP
jgi:hypothetical protein